MDYDVVVIGAGIQGAAVAQAASAAGYRTLVLEQYDQPASGTSSRSSKLIHGGLRYLESGQFALVHECLVERARLLSNAPQLVKLVPFHIPVYRDTQRRPWKITAGLLLYALLSRKPFHRLPRSQWSQLDGLNTNGLDAVFSYYDAQTDDAMLTRAVLASAQSLGTEVRFNARFESCQVTPETCQVKYALNNQPASIQTRCLVNAAGPWVDQIAKRITPPAPLPRVELVQGTHIEIPGNLARGMYYLEAPQDQRAVFVMPWKDHLLVGTTETAYTGDPAKVKPLDSEIHYLLTVYNHYFDRNLGPDSVIHAFAGLRVLPGGDSRAFSRPRDTLIVTDNKHQPRILSLYGGKLTAQRATAEAVMEKLHRTLPGHQPIADTRTLRLPDSEQE